MKKLISFVIPAYNEAANINELAKRLIAVFAKNKRYNFEVLIVENGSTDQTLKKLLALRRRDKRFKIIRLSRNFGCDGGIAAGLHFVQGDAAVIMMADLQEPPEIVPKLLRRWEKGFDTVYGVVEERQGMSWTRKLSTNFFYKLINLLTQGKLPENVSDFRLIDKKIYQVINAMPEHGKFMRGLMMWPGFSHTGVKFKRLPRFAGKSKADWATVFEVALNGIFSFSSFPLRLISLTGVIVTFIATLLIAVQLTKIFVLHNGSVNSLSNIITAFLLGLILLALGVIGEYLARIYDEVRNRPNFVVQQKIGL